MAHLQPRLLILATLCLTPIAAGAQERDLSKFPFFATYCGDCHADGAKEGGFELGKLGIDLTDAATFARWERIYDRIDLREMPPGDADQPEEQERAGFLKVLHGRLSAAHAQSKGTVLRRLNRREYQNTINDLFGANLSFQKMLPADGKASEFDNVGDALALSMVHLQRYIDAANLAFDTAIASTAERPPAKRITASYLNSQEAERFINKRWKKLADGAIVRFSSGGYPSGMLRGSSVRTSGRYRVRVTGYAHQSPQPITFSVGGTSYERGSAKPIYGFWSFPPGEPGRASTIEFETWIERNYMIAVEPYGISDPQRYQRQSIVGYQGPGLAIVEVTIDGPLYDQWPSKGHRLLLDGVQRRATGRQVRVRKQGRTVRQDVFEIETEDELGDARRILLRVAESAFRRPVQSDEVGRFVALFERERGKDESFEAAIRTAATAIFCSPKFLYFQESPGELDDFALANRLAYFLTRTAPDQKLRDAAATQSLHRDAELQAQTDRLLGEPEFERFLIDFTDSWLDLREMDSTAPDRKLFPEFDPYLRYSMPRETRSYLRELIESDLSVTHLVRSDFAMLNSRLAEHYELPPVTGAELRKVMLPPNSVRGGLLSQASVLKVTANGTNTSPVTRGAWVLERILGTPPPPPPPGVPGVEPDIRGAATLRELLKKHRDTAACNACHRQIDPPGFALESFNPIGGFRDRYRSLGEGQRVQLLVNGRNVGYRIGQPVDTSGELPGGERFQGFREFSEHLAAAPDRLAQTLTEKLLVFATGRELGFSDRAEVQRIVEQSARQGHGVRNLIHLVVQSDVFRHK